jgi:hypothetical protein
MTMKNAGAVGSGSEPGAANEAALHEIKRKAAEASELLLWATAQGASLAKLKLFNTMAKSVNDQQ